MSRQRPVSWRAPARFGVRSAGIQFADMLAGYLEEMMNRVGVRGCTFLAALAAGVITFATEHASAAERGHNGHQWDGSVFVDPLGFALFGPRLGVEVGHRHISAALYGRWFSPGLLGHSLFLKTDDEFGFSYGVGVRGRWYFGHNLDRFHLGLAAEYLHTRVENKVSLIGTDSGYLVPYVEAGYRICWGRFYLDPSAGIGYAGRLSSKAENLRGGDPRRDLTVVNESTVYGTASLDLGILF
jgi:hypothetical protein